MDFVRACNNGQSRNRARLCPFLRKAQTMLVMSAYFASPHDPILPRGAPSVIHSAIIRISSLNSGVAALENGSRGSDCSSSTARNITSMRSLAFGGPAFKGKKTKIFTQKSKTAGGQKTQLTKRVISSWALLLGSRKPNTGFTRYRALFVVLTLKARRPWCKVKSK